ncbi:MAG: peptidylprolyl isomerase [Gemmataceae bacterium]
MPKRLCAILCLALLGLGLASCGNCGWQWDDGAHACHSAPLSH